eukprot:CAMPEP_0181363180 /NCGR_PEP_ID=MMETSP1106-20121128/8543_1 /TAXON_ID=81844 /ORGANISM="Mantoniella antarctica, Strain SL-175" /LENGTH=226 /DNA_ID=CAMNT_0023477465 /DNA_START=356 /DNA_END=1037 /DNA_ORIENTATION=+
MKREQGPCAVAPHDSKSTVSLSSAGHHENPGGGLGGVHVRGVVDFSQRGGHPVQHVRAHRVPFPRGAHHDPPMAFCSPLVRAGLTDGGAGNAVVVLGMCCFVGSTASSGVGCESGMVALARSSPPSAPSGRQWSESPGALLVADIGVALVLSTSCLSEEDMMTRSRLGSHASGAASPPTGFNGGGGATTVPFRGVPGRLPGSACPSSVDISTQRQKFPRTSALPQK